MTTPRKRSTRRPVEKDLFGDPVSSPPPERKIVLRPDGRGYSIAVRVPGGTAYDYLGVYATRAEAAVAFRDGVGKRDDRDAVVVSVSVYLSPARRRK